MLPFALTIFTGAFLLFQVQPLIGKFILPWFGGSPGVWTTCMLFFQILLLGGYAYAHYLTEHCKPRTQAIVHGILIALSLAMLPIMPAESWKPAGELANPTGRILILLLCTIGLPYFVLSTTGPLMQRWFNWLNPGVSPYRLYALSNVGSLLALVSYPFLFEPALSRKAQAYAWSGGLVVFAIAAGYCAWQLVKRAGNITNASASTTTEPVPPTTWGQRIVWLVLPAVAVVMLLATTNKLCQDVAVIPFLWVLPLSLYLITFILCFDHPRWYSRTIFGALTLCAIGIPYGLAYFGAKSANGGTLPSWIQNLPDWTKGFGGVWAAMHFGHDVPLTAQVIAYAGLLFFACMICHGELAQLKPHPRHLTQYFMLIAAGGALGGTFVAVGAPQMFADYYEFHWGTFLCACVTVVFLYRDERLMRALRVPFVIRILLVATLVWTGFLMLEDTAGAKKDAVAMRRNFYGALTVFEYDKDNPESHYFLLQHGKITHGLQLADPTFKNIPTSYYTEKSGVAVALNNFPRRIHRRIGVVGLGTGTMAAHGKEGDYVRIYEINPIVKQIAESRFSYLRDSPAKVEIAMGDARLSMETEPPQEFDLLVLDAFSSDAIPVHLLTRESLAIYRRQLKPDGVLAVHISNRYLDLEPVVGMLAEDMKWKAWVVDDDTEPEWWMYSSTWVLVTNNEDLLTNDAVISAGRAIKKPDRPMRLWTDDYTALVEVLKR